MNDWYVTPGIYDSFSSFVLLAEMFLEKYKTVRVKRNILIIGDSGVGKSLFIEAFRQLFIKITQKDNIYRLNCAAFTEELIESELFGHVKGAFTGALANKKGLLEEANAGLIVLDEIGELSDQLQAKLLIFIEEGQFRPVGSNEIKNSSVTILGSTNKQKDDFRSDFWFRFYPFHIPPLHERRMDVLYYLAIKEAKLFMSLDNQTILRFLCYNWPGNIRELERVIDNVELKNAINRLRLKESDIKSDFLDNFYDTNYQTFLSDDKIVTDLHLDEHCNLGNRLLAGGYDLAKLNEGLVKYNISIPYDESNLDSPDFNAKSSEYNKNKENSVVENNKYLDSNGGNEFVAIKDNVDDINHKKEIFALLRETLKYGLGKSAYEKLHEDNVNQDFSSDAEMQKNGIPPCPDSKDKFTILKKQYYLFKNIYVVSTHELLESIELGFNAFSNICLLNNKGNFPLLNARKFECCSKISNYDEYKIIKHFQREKLVIPIIELLLDSRMDYSGEIESSHSWAEAFQKMYLKNRNKFDKLFLNEHASLLHDEKNILDSTYNELSRKYFAYLISKYKTKRAASKVAGIKYPTFQGKLRRLGNL